ncbi:MAG: polyprenyl synthetase family protein [Bdellovibrionaceae bacterium]|jgi:octaprenyl-diphosphate synthase|nr:polyprenyl synthetase family protein [Pseudobdellovibrionaceae bacterium]
MLENIKVYSSKDFPEYLPKLNALYEDLFSKGKGFRSKLIQKCSKHLNLSSKQIHLLAQTIEFIHNASLLHDDLIDRSELRRNKPAAWLKYTPEYAVLAGDYLLARVMVNLSRYGNLPLLQYTAEMISDLLEGEWIQDSLVHDLSVRLDQLDRVHHLKTASLFRWCIKAPFVMKNEENQFILQLLDELGSIIGLLFQRSDDLLDFNIRNHENKAVLGDLKSGYINSFGAFLSEDFDDEKKMQFKLCETVDDVKQLVGESEFKRSLEKFDAINKEVIDLYFHHLDSLGDQLPQESKGLVEDLRKLPEPLYWRNQ